MLHVLPAILNEQGSCLDVRDYISKKKTIFHMFPISLYTSSRLQTELKYPSKNRRRFTQRYNMTKIIFS